MVGGWGWQHTSGQAWVEMHGLVPMLLRVVHTQLLYFIYVFNVLAVSVIMLCYRLRASDAYCSREYTVYRCPASLVRQN